VKFNSNQFNNIINLLNVEKLQHPSASGSSIDLSIDGKSTLYQPTLVNPSVSGSSNVTEQTLTDGTNIVWNWETQQNAKVTLGGARTLSNPSGLAAGEYASLRVIQDSSGGRTLAFSANYKGVTDMTLTTDINAVDWLLFRAVDSTTCELVGYRTNIGV